MGYNDSGEPIDIGAGVPDIITVGGVRQPLPRIEPLQFYYVWVFYAEATNQHYYYTASTKNITPAAIKNIRIRYTVKARSEHDAIARCLLEGYATKDSY